MPLVIDSSHRRTPYRMDAVRWYMIKWHKKHLVKKPSELSCQVISCRRTSAKCLVLSSYKPVVETASGMRDICSRGCNLSSVYEWWSSKRCDLKSLLQHCYCRGIIWRRTPFQQIHAKRPCWDLQHASRVHSCSLYASDINLWKVPVNTVYMCERNVVPRLTPHVGHVLYLRKLGTFASVSFSLFFSDKTVQSFTPSISTRSAGVHAAEFDRTFVPFFDYAYMHLMSACECVCRQGCNGTGAP